MPHHPSPYSTAAQSALDRTADLIQHLGGRLAGSEACYQAALALQAGLRRFCGSASLEPFTTRPGAFTGFYRIDAMLYLAGLGLMIFGHPLLAGLVLLFMVTAAGLQFGWYVELYDRFYPRKTCHNLTAVLEPRGEARRQLIFSAHHDSANELKFLRKNQKLYGLKILIPDTFRMTATLFAWTWVFHQVMYGRPPAFTPWMLCWLVLGLFSVFTKFFAFGAQAVPGAGDNLIASAMLLELAGMLVDPQQPGRSRLEHTRLVFASFDAEESGLRGSRAWAKAHAAQLRALPTWALNIDSIYSAADLQFLISDLNSHVPLDRALAERCQRIAREGGCPAGLAPMRFGGGATDATELALAGARATTLIAMPAGIIRDGLVYHTMRDTVDAIQPEAVEDCLRVADALAWELDVETSAGFMEKRVTIQERADPL